jgi:DNA-directed RNA polymerase II subunit RPB7
MFYIGEITRYIMLDPKFLYKDYKGHIERIVRENVEGRCLGKKGYAIAVVNITDQKLGLIDNNTGGVKVTVKLQVLFMKFFINEVIDVVVSSVNEYGITVKAGPVEGIIWSSADVDGIPANYRFSTENGDCYERFGDDTEVSLIGITDCWYCCGG